MPTNRSSWIHVDLGPKMDISADIADGDVVINTAPMPVAGTIKLIYACADVLPTAGTLALAKAVGTTNVNVLSATNLNLATGLTANVGSSLTLATTATSLHVDAGNMLRATWTFTTIGSGEGFGCIVAIEPDIW